MGLVGLTPSWARSQLNTVAPEVGNAVRLLADDPELQEHLRAKPELIDTETETLESHGVASIADRVSVAIDLRQDWPKALVDVGFDPTAPTSWSAEGRLPYLTAEAQDLLFDRIQITSMQSALTRPFWCPHQGSNLGPAD
jgi:hypothetical protein